MMAHPAMGGSKGKDVRRARAYPVRLTDAEVAQLSAFTDLDGDRRRHLDAILSHTIVFMNLSIDVANTYLRDGLRNVIDALTLARDALRSDYLPDPLGGPVSTTDLRHALDSYLTHASTSLALMPRARRGPRRYLYRRGALVDGLRDFYRLAAEPADTPDAHADQRREEDRFVRLAASFVGVTFPRDKTLPTLRRKPPPP